MEPHAHSHKRTHTNTHNHIHNHIHTQTHSRAHSLTLTHPHSPSLTHSRTLTNSQPRAARYLLPTGGVVRLLARVLLEETADTMTRQNALGAVQKFSLRSRPQEILIELKVVEWLVRTLRDIEALSEYRWVARQRPRGVNGVGALAV